MENIDWLEPWVEVQLIGLADELQREVKPGHPLYRIEAREIARRTDCDEVLFALVNNSHAFVVVHLTFTLSECEPQWPQIRFFDTFEHWVENCMKPDQRRYQLGEST